ncbi:MAG TPA: helix-turn-helix transcriptional regulator, partial [Candidatus Poseidoniaceae archaeon]
VNHQTDQALGSSEVNKLISLLSELIKPRDSKTPIKRGNFIESLLGLSNDKYAEKVDYPLNPVALSSLSASESYIVSIAKVRKYSPSDKEILAHLEIKRPRLSQISNKLLKSGILNARMKGRSRYYELTQSAKAQLIAWGILESDA